MSEKIQTLRGMKDHIADDAEKLQKIMDIAADTVRLYGFHEIITPIMEKLSVFKRSLGESSDVVSKEMYVFQDRSETEICLRPENTASVVRAFIENGLTQKLPQKFFYRGPMFRYERPQKGRLRQFHQIGVETLGAHEAQTDAEIIALGLHFLQKLGVADKTTLELNSLGDRESRKKYRDALVQYFSSFKNDLSFDSQKRLVENPLRILDSKDENDKKIIQDAPLLSHFLNKESRHFFDKLQDFLTQLDIAYTHNETLVRGLDYYCHTAFEFTTKELGAQGTVLGGGRYDGLVSMMGGEDIAGIGFAAGVERLVMLTDLPPARNTCISLAAFHEEKEKEAFCLAHALRHEGYEVDYYYHSSLKKRLKHANNIHAAWFVILEDQEKEDHYYSVKSMKDGQQFHIAKDALFSFFAKNA